MEWGRAGHGKEGLQRGRKKLLEVTTLMVGMDFHKHIHMSELVYFSHVQFIVCQFSKAGFFFKLSEGFHYFYRRMGFTVFVLILKLFA